MAEARARREEEVRTIAARRFAVPESVILRDRMRWGPVWAGAVITLAVELILSTIGIAISFVAGNITTLADLSSVSTYIIIWAAFSAIVSLFVGGYFTSRLMPVDTREMGMINSVVTWALILLLGSIISFFGISLILGFLGSIAATSGAISPSVFTGMSGSAQLSSTIRTIAVSSGWFILWSLFGLGAAILGGYLGMVGNQERSREIP